MTDINEIEAVGEWLVSQLEAWPRRIDNDRTINIEYLMQEAAATIHTLTEERDKLREALQEAITWDGSDDFGVEAVWLDDARAALSPTSDVVGA